ncbi:hypothetical protein ACE7GA_05190 [Roseomonas sp. CCTCC AB2023176]|uniref:hypothetical protein n=1 Tax=Roseomonas sp. CCTCC AB2023176 TaxID=3342640 RepID=UPI0035DCE896
MTDASKKDRRAEEQGSGKGGESNAAGTQAGPGATQESATGRGNLDTNKGAQSASGAMGRPGHKNTDR